MQGLAYAFEAPWLMEVIFFRVFCLGLLRVQLHKLPAIADTPLLTWKYVAMLTLFYFYFSCFWRMKIWVWLCSSIFQTGAWTLYKAHNFNSKTISMKTKNLGIDVAQLTFEYWECIGVVILSKGVTHQQLNFRLKVFSFLYQTINSLQDIILSITDKISCRNIPNIETQNQ